jgi:hypothetical protein
LIVLIANAHRLFGSANPTSSLALEGVPNLTIRTHRSVPQISPGDRSPEGQTDPDYLLQSRPQTTPSTCSMRHPLETRRAFPGPHH